MKAFVLDGSRMTTTETPPRRRLFLPAALGAIAAVVAGAVLYGTLAPAGKVGGVCPASSRALAAKLAPLATGDAAAVAIASDPRPALPLAFERADGAKTTLAEFHGRNLLLNLWATWCVPCRAEMPSLDRLQAQKGGESFEVVAVNVDTARLERRGAFLDGIGVKTLARYADPSGDAFETLRQDGKALGLPVTMLIDKDGCEIGVAAGAVKWDSPAALALIGALKGG
jgi:thiol-disulfide isomerase/thioredoxin